MTMEMSISKNIPWCIAQCLFWAKALSSDTTCTTHHIASTSSREIQRIPSRPCAVARMNADQDIHSWMFTLLLNTCSHNGLRGCAKWPQASISHYITGEHTHWLIQNYLKLFLSVGNAILLWSLELTPTIFLPHLLQLGAR